MRAVTRTWGREETTRHVAQWKNAYLAHMKAWVQSQHNINPVWWYTLITQHSRGHMRDEELRSSSATLSLRSASQT